MSAAGDVVKAVDPSPAVKSFAARASPDQMLLALVLALFGYVVLDLSKSVRELASAVARLEGPPKGER